MEDVNENLIFESQTSGNVRIQRSAENEEELDDDISAHVLSSTSNSSRNR